MRFEPVKRGRLAGGQKRAVLSNSFGRRPSHRTCPSFLKLCRHGWRCNAPRPFSQVALSDTPRGMEAAERRQHGCVRLRAAATGHTVARRQSAATRHAVAGRQKGRRRVHPTSRACRKKMAGRPGFGGPGAQAAGRRSGKHRKHKAPYRDIKNIPGPDAGRRGEERGGGPPPQEGGVTVAGAIIRDAVGGEESGC